MGLPQLTGVNLEKVRLANTLHEKLVHFLVVAAKRKILWSVENPKNSLLWEIPFFAELYVNAEFVYFDACCYRGERLTAKAILTTCRTLFSLAQKCQGGHPREPFGKIKLPNGRSYWATKDEAQYPRPVCVQIVSLVSQALGVLWDPACAEIGVVRSEGEDSNLNFLLVFGVFHTEFVHAALQCEHPMDQLFGLDDLVIEVIARDRIAFFTKWSARAAQLKEQEVSLHKSLPTDVASVLKGKNLLLLEEMARPWVGLTRMFLRSLG